MHTFVGGIGHAPCPMVIVNIFVYFIHFMPYLTTESQPKKKDEKKNEMKLCRTRRQHDAKKKKVRIEKRSADEIGVSCAW